ncbi:MAG: hypothetical protein COA93_05965 [Alphaproteobacteria bacterium]|nr:MAG: hypothetical protein COA93_05965 [Alphaproteobacteria bacterium]
MKKILLLLIICLGNTINVFSATPIDEYSENYCFLFEGKEHGAIASKTGSYCPVVGVFPRTHPHSWKWRNSLIEAYVTLKLSVTPFGTTKSIIVLDSYVRYLQTEKTSDGIKKEIIEKSPASYFHRPAAKAAWKLKYKPLVLDDEGVETENVIVRFFYYPREINKLR